MKTYKVENLITREQLICKNLKDISTIDGVEYLRVCKMDSRREFLIKKDAIKLLKAK